MNIEKEILWKALQNQAEQSFFYFNKFDENSLKHPAQQKKVAACHIALDYTHQSITQEIFDLLCKLAHACDLSKKIQALFQGKKVNITENRPALHTALRVEKKHPSLWVDEENILDQVFSSLNQIRQISEQIRTKKWLGYSGKAITDVINIGMGGSDLGPRFCIQALKDYVTTALHFHFISDIDQDRFEKTLTKLNPETTLFIICSKSFTTKETLYNAKQAMDWVGHQHANHFIAVTANGEKAQNEGYQHIIPIWDWIGGRFSFCSGINLITAIAIGFAQFEHLLTGARHMDTHFLENDFPQNLPVVYALIGIWNINFLHINNQLLLTYGHQLDGLVPFVQQLEMESNGKSSDNQNKAINYATAPIVWGGPGNQAQHSYYQLLCQGMHRIAIDLLTLNQPKQYQINTACNKTIEALSTGQNPFSNPRHRKQPLTHITINQCSPYTIGALTAMLEHKIFIQSVIWNINPFDQPGVQTLKYTTQSL